MNFLKQAFIYKGKQQSFVINKIQMECLITTADTYTTRVVCDRHIKS